MSEIKEKEQLEKSSCNTPSSDPREQEKMTKKEQEQKTCNQTDQKQGATQQNTEHKHGGCSH